MSQARWAVVTTYAAGIEADIAIERLKSAGIPAIRRENDIAGLFGTGFQGPTARGVTVLAPWNVIGDACEILGVAARVDAEHILSDHWQNAANWNGDGSYRCAEDPRLVVPKRNGVGWTINVAHRRAQAVMWLLLLAAVALVAVIGFSATARAQAPLAFQPGLQPPSELAPALRQAIKELAPQYPFEGVRVFGTDSVLLVFADSTFTGESSRSNRWMFGPAVTSAEADSCPPEKVLGRKLARTYWRATGRPTEIKQILVAVHGTVGVDRWSVITMYYTYGQLAAKWVGDDGPR